jgi:formylglycine-generating enzyme required for sulfatase activity
MLSAGLVASACALFPSLDDLTNGGSDAATDADASSDVFVGDAGVDATRPDADADASPCPSLHGPSMVQVPTPNGSFCIDSTEVTTTDYAAFVLAVSKGDPIAKPPSGVCAWNTTIAPATTGSCNADTTSATTHPNRPMSCVNWCDAYAYCAWAGKRMCGAIDGGVLPFNTVIGQTNQMFAACSANGAQPYPYGPAYVSGNCNTKDLYGDSGTNAVADVKQFTKCVGGYPGINDLVGNVEEWIDSCQEKGEGGANDSCHESGDCFDYVVTGPARCDNTDSDTRSHVIYDVGIRCCSP